MTTELSSTDMDITEEAIGGADLAHPGGINPFESAVTMMLYLPLPDFGSTLRAFDTAPSEPEATQWDPTRIFPSEVGADEADASQMCKFVSLCLRHYRDGNRKYWQIDSRLVEEKAKLSGGRINDLTKVFEPVDHGTAYFSNSSEGSDGLACWQREYQAIQLDTGKALIKALILSLEVELESYKIWTHSTNHYLAWMRHIITQHLRLEHHSISDSDKLALASLIKQLQNVLKVARLKMELINLGNTIRLRPPVEAKSRQRVDPVVSAVSSTPNEKSMDKSFPIQTSTCTPSSLVENEQKAIPVAGQRSRIATDPMETDSTPSLFTLRSSQSPFASSSINHTSARLLFLSLAALEPSTEAAAIQPESRSGNRTGGPRGHPPHITRSESLDVAAVAHSPDMKMVLSESESGNGSSGASDSSARKRLPDVTLQSLIETSNERTRKRLPDATLQSWIERSKADAPKTVLDHSLHDSYTDHASQCSHLVQLKSGRYFGGPAGLPPIIPGNVNWIGQSEHQHARRYDQQTCRPPSNNVTRTMDSYVPSYSFDFHPSYDESGPSRLRAWPATRQTTLPAPRDAISPALAKVSFHDPAPGTSVAPLDSKILADPKPPSSLTAKRKRCEDFFADDDVESKDQPSDKPSQEPREKRIRTGLGKGDRGSGAVKKARKAEEAKAKAASLALAAWSQQ